MPRYKDDLPFDDDDRDVFILSGSEDLVPIAATPDGDVRYRPRTEGLYARIVHYCTSGQDYWEVTAKDGLVSRYGSIRPNPESVDPAVIADPDNPDHIFAWKLTETRDPLGNLIVYEYDTDAGDIDVHRGRQPRLRSIRYADWFDESGRRDFFATVDFAYDPEPRDDAFSSYTAGFEIRTNWRCTSITTAVHPAVKVPARCYELRYDTDPFSGVSLLREVELVGFDDDGTPQRDLPPVSFSYSRLDPVQRRFRPVRGRDLPVVPLSDHGHELVDLTGHGLPDVLECNGTIRYWRNRGDGSFDLAHSMHNAPAGIHLGSAGVRLLDADGNGRADLMVTNQLQSGYWSLRFGPRPSWGRFRSHRRAPSIALTDPEVRLIDLNGDGVTDAVQAGSSLLCWFNDPDTGWTGPKPAHFPSDDLPPDLDLTNPRVRWADMTGDGLTDLVLLRGRSIEYRPNVGHGRFGRRIRMSNAPDLPVGYDPARLHLGNVAGNGLADLVYVEAHRVQVWINQCGNRWSEPIPVRGLPAAGWDVRITDLLGTGTCGLLSSQAGGRDRPSMYFLDLAGGVKPGLLVGVDNHIGSTTTIQYTSSATMAARDFPNPKTRWRTPLPFPVQVVERVRSVDAISHSTLSTEYHYRHGYWDGREREFRGFGCVEQTDAETRSSDSELSAMTPSVVTPTPPTLTRMWFHLGPVDAEDGTWTDLDLTDEYWKDDPHLLAQHGHVQAYLKTLPETGSSGRDAVRVLRGRPLRTELYGLDGSAQADQGRSGHRCCAGRPYTVTEHAYELRQEPAAGSRPVFAAFETAQRTSQWERGDDPMTRFTFIGDYDEVGQPGHRTIVAPMRRTTRRLKVSGAVVGLRWVDFWGSHPIIHTRTRYAADAEHVGIHNRVADERLYQYGVVPTLDVVETDKDNIATVLADQHRFALQVRDFFAALDPAKVRLIEHVVHHYDGAAYNGCGPGVLGKHGLLTRTEKLVFTSRVLDFAYKDWRTQTNLRPTYLEGPAELPAGAPPAFGADLGYHKQPGDDWYAEGWYADTTRQAYDVQLSTTSTPLPTCGLVLGSQDALGHEPTRFTPDRYWLLPVSVRDPAGLETTVAPHYRTGQPALLVDPNGTKHYARYHPLGMLSLAYQVGLDGRGGTEERPETIHQYDLSAFRKTPGQPISVHTVRRVHYASDGISDEVIEAWEYSDGFGRVVQQRTQADDLAFGEDGDDPGLLIPQVGGWSTAVPGRVGGPAVGTRMADRWVVSGWQVYDHKGRVIEKYQPFLSAGRRYEQDLKRGRPVRMTYDPLGRSIRIDNPDGSQRRTVFGIPADLAKPDVVDQPTPWVITEYDENDLAPLCIGVDGASLGDRVPVEQHYTPTTTILNPLGYEFSRIRRGTADPTNWHLTWLVKDLRGNVIQVFDEMGRMTLAHAYDHTNRRLRTYSIDSGFHISVLDAAGNLRHTHDARGAQAFRAFDALNRLRELSACDTSGKPVTLRERLTYGDDDPNRQASRTSRRLGRLLTHLDEAGLQAAQSYDLAGPPTEQTRRVINDPTLAAADATGGWTADWATMNPDDVLENGEDRTSTQYDALGRVTQTTAPEDATGHRAHITARYSRSGALQVVQHDGVEHVRLLAHNARGQRVLLALGNGLITRYAYDPDTFLLVRLRTERADVIDDVWTGEGEPLQDLTYSYDLLGNVRTVEERTVGCGVANTVNGRHRLIRTFDYDGFSRLVSATGRECTAIAALRPLDDTPRCGAYGAPFSPPPNAPNQDNAPDVTSRYRESYAYDPAGNILDLHHEGLDTPGAEWHRKFGMGQHPPDGWVDAANNQLTTIVAGTQKTSLCYDAGGNLTKENDSRVYQWDHAGRLVGFRVRAGAGTSISACYLYTADGRRAKKWVRRNGAANLDESTTYIGDLLERHTWTAKGGGANTLLQISDAATRVALVRTGPAHPDDAGPAMRYELADHLGSVALTVDGTGGWINREEYFPYGETSFGSFARRRYRFTGKERDEESGLTFHGARYDAPAALRWISCDPAGTVDGLSPYLYASNNPMRWIDPTGREKVVPTDNVCRPSDNDAGTTGDAEDPLKSGPGSPGSTGLGSAPTGARTAVEELARPASAIGARPEGTLHLWSGAAGKAEAKASIAADKSGWMMGDIDGTPTPQHLAGEREFAAARAKAPGGRIPDKQFDAIWGPRSAEVVGRGAFSGHPVEAHGTPEPKSIQPRYEWPARSIGGGLRGVFGTGTGLFSAISGAQDPNALLRVTLSLSGVGEATSAIMYGAGAYGASTTAMAIGTAGMTLFGGVGAAVGFGTASARSFAAGDKLSGVVNGLGAIGGVLLVASLFTPVGWVATAGVVLVALAAGYNIGNWLAR